jgi:Xaa-Pro aminopeptidase
MSDARIERLRGEMAVASLDTLVLTNPHNVRYATGYHSILERWGLPEPLAAVIVPLDPAGPVTLCLPEANVALLAVAEEQGQPTRAQQLRVFDLLNFCQMARAPDEHAGASALGEAAMALYGDKVQGSCHPDILSAIAAGLHDLGLGNGRVGFDDLRVAGRVASDEYDLRLETCDALDLTLRARIVKTPEELDTFRRIGKIADRVMQFAANRLAAGIDWNDLQADVADLMTRAGAVPVDEGAMLFGGSFAGEFIPELFRTRHDRPLEAGQIVILETLGIAEGFWLDINRTAVIGEPTAEYQRQHDVIRDAYLKMVDEMQPGQSTGRLPAIGYEHLKEQGVPAPEKLLVVAHGVGHQPLEFPLSYPSQGLKGAGGFELQESMVISLDCLYFGSKYGPCHMENVFIIEANGAVSTYETPLELLGPRGG